MFEVLRVFQESFKDVSRKIEGCFNEILNGSKVFKEVQWVFEEIFKGSSRMFQGSFKGVSRKIEGCS